MKKILIAMLLGVTSFGASAAPKDKQIMFFWGDPPAQQSSTDTPAPKQGSVAPKPAETPTSAPNTASPEVKSPVGKLEGEATQELKKIEKEKQGFKPKAKPEKDKDSKSGSVSRDTKPPLVEAQAVPDYPAVEKIQIWKVSKGEGLKGTLSRWAKEAGWQEPVWDEWFQDRDLEIQGGGEFRGDFPVAVADLFEALPDFKGFATYSKVNKLILISIKH